MAPTKPLGRLSNVDDESHSLRVRMCSVPMNCTEAWTIGRRFTDDNYKCILLNAVWLCLVPEWQQIIIGGGTGLVPNRQQAITWINDDEVYDAIWRH